MKHAIIYTLLLFTFTTSAQEARFTTCTASGTHVSGDFSIKDGGKYLYAIGAEIPAYPVSFQVATVPDRDALTASTGDICKVLNTVDTRYPGFSGAQYFRKQGTVWQMLPNRINVCRLIVSATDTSATLDAPINSDAPFTAIVGPNAYDELQRQVEQGGTVDIEAGMYLVVLDSISRKGLQPAQKCRIFGNGATVYAVMRQPYNTQLTLSVFAQQGSFNQDQSRVLELHDLTIKGFAFADPLREIQPRLYGVNWADGSGALTVHGCRFAGLFGAIQSTGDCLPPCAGERTLNVAQTKIDSIYGVGIGLFGRQNFLNAYNITLWRVGVVSKWTRFNQEYGQGIYLHKRNSYHITASRFTEIRTHAISPFSSGGQRAAIQYVGGCTFKNVSGGVLTDADAQTTIQGCTFDAAQIGIQGPSIVSACTFLDSSLACIYTSCCASQSATVHYRVDGCHFIGTKSYAIDQQNSSNQTVIGHFSNSTIESKAGVGVNVHSGELHINNVVFYGQAARSVYADGGAVFVQNSTFRQTNQTQTILSVGCSSIRGSENWFYSPTIKTDGTCAGFLFRNNIEGSATWQGSNPNFQHD